MRLQLITRFSLMAIIVSSLFSCNEKEEFVTENIADYLPLAIGKYVVYRLDSLVFTEFGRVKEIHRYQEKDEVDGIFTDLSGRTSYRIRRYLRDSLGTGFWQPIGTYSITPLTDQIETLEDNLRFISLHMPMKDAFSWKGNRYLPGDPYHLKYNFSNDNEIQLWDYYYDGQSSSFSYRGNNYTDVFSINQVDDKILVDTFQVIPTNQVQIPANKTSVWVAGNASDVITLNATNPTFSNLEMRVYNYSNNLVRLNGITTPVGFSRNYEYRNGQWGFGNNGKDTLYSDLPYGYKNYALEKYSKKIGLVYKEYELWEYQPNTGGSGGAYYTGFGIRKWMIDHN